VAYIDEVASLFLLTELNTGLTFVQIALGSRKYSRERVLRNQANARLAHDTLLRFKPRIHLTHTEQVNFDEKFAILQDGLRQLGEAV
jgi:hypothetical protein